MRMEMEVEIKVFDMSSTPRWTSSSSLSEFSPNWLQNNEKKDQLFLNQGGFRQLFPNFFQNKKIISLTGLLHLIITYK